MEKEILVVAIAAIVVFFTIGLSDIVLEKEANLLLNRLTKKSFTVKNSRDTIRPKKARMSEGQKENQSEVRARSSRKQLRTIRSHQI